MVDADWPTQLHTSARRLHFCIPRIARQTLVMPNASRNIARLLTERQTDTRGREARVREVCRSSALIRRLGRMRKLSGHTGCVNTVRYSKSGRLLVTVGVTALPAAPVAHSHL